MHRHYENPPEVQGSAAFDGPAAGAYAPVPFAEGAPLQPQGAPRYGSVSARARQTYATEAMLNKSHIIAALFAFFLGAFGVHKFYLGCNQAGYVMMAFSIIGGLVTFGLAALLIQVIAFVEGLIYLSESQASFDYIYVANQRDWF